MMDVWLIYFPGWLSQVRLNSILVWLSGIKEKPIWGIERNF